MVGFTVGPLPGQDNFGAVVSGLTPESLDETYERMRHHQGVAWIGLYRPRPEEIQSVAAEFGLNGSAA